MCNDFGNKIKLEEYEDAFQHFRAPLKFRRGRPNLQPVDEIWPSDPAPIIRPFEDGVELVTHVWGLRTSLKQTPIINMTSEVNKFKPELGFKEYEGIRCLIPASHYFEFTGTSTPKKRWRLTRKGEEWFCFAGVIGKAITKDGELDAFSMLTISPGEDTKPLHDREPVILDREQWSDWLMGKPANDIIHSSLAESMFVKENPREGKRMAQGSLF